MGVGNGVGSSPSLRAQKQAESEVGTRIWKEPERVQYNSAKFLPLTGDFIFCSPRLYFSFLCWMFYSDSALVNGPCASFFVMSMHYLKQEGRVLAGHGKRKSNGSALCCDSPFAFAAVATKKKRGVGGWGGALLTRPELKRIFFCDCGCSCVFLRAAGFGL